VCAGATVSLWCYCKGTLSPASHAELISSSDLEKYKKLSYR